MMKSIQVFLFLIAAFVNNINGQGQPGELWKAACMGSAQKQCTYIIQAEIAGYAMAKVTPAEVATCMKHNTKALCDAETAGCDWCPITTPEGSTANLESKYGAGLCAPKKLSTGGIQFCSTLINNGLIPLETELSSVTPRPQKPSYVDQAKCLEKSGSETACKEPKATDGTTEFCSYCQVPKVYGYTTDEGYCSPKTFAETKLSGSLDLCQQIKSLDTTVAVTTTTTTTTVKGSQGQVNGSFQTVLSTSIFFTVLAALLYCH